MKKLNFLCSHAKVSIGHVSEQMQAQIQHACKYLLACTIALNQVLHVSISTCMYGPMEHDDAIFAIGHT